MNDRRSLYPLDMNGLVNYIKSPRCKRIAFLTGAGVSVAAGIPDFRSPGGMYDTLRPELLTATDEQRALMNDDPTYVVNWELFQENQFCYLELRRPFILGLAENQWKPTIAHWFIRLCYEKGLLARLYTQNIDGLDFQLDINKDKIVPVHGTMGQVSCEYCGSSYEIKDFEQQVRLNIKDIYKIDKDAPSMSKEIICKSCHKPGVKPSTVLYGRSLPTRFYDCSQMDFPDNVDLLIIAGTSLSVGPANTLVTQVSPQTPRVVINNEQVADFWIDYNPETSTRDVFLSGFCEDVFIELITRLGWLDDLLKHEDNICESGRALIEKHREWLNVVE